MNQVSISKKFWIVLSAFVVIGAIFAYYLLIYVKNREENIVGEKYRILKQNGRNVLAIRGDYTKRIENYSKMYARTKPISDSLFSVSLELQAQLYNYEIEYWDTYYTEDVGGMKRVEDSINIVKARINEIKKKEEEIISRLEAPLRLINLETVRAEYDSMRYEDPEHLYFNVALEHFTEDTYYSYDESPESSGRCLRVPLTSFLNKSNFNYSKFDDFLLIRVLHKKESAKPEAKDSESYSSYYPEEEVYDQDKATYNLKIDCCQTQEDKPNSNVVISSIAFQTFDNKIDLSSNQLDSLFIIDHGLRSVSVLDISLAGVSYKMFPHYMQFEEDEEWVLCGLLKSSTFKQASREIETWKLAFATLIIIFLILAMPILKLLIMSAIERLRIINVWSTGFSIILSTALLVLILLTGNEMMGYKTEIDENLKSLSNEIRGRFIEELDTICDQLDVSKTFYQVPSANNFKLLSDIFKSMPDSTKTAQFPHHQFFRDLLWLDKYGNQLLRMSTYEQDPKIIPLSLGERKYFSRSNHDSLWVLPHHGDTSRFALESIRSWVSGKHEAGIGIKLDQAHGQATVLAMATKLYSVIDPLLPPGYGFCIIDERGVVQFHSDSKRNTQEIFLDEVHQDKKIKAAMVGRLVKSGLEAEYNAREHRMFIQPIDNIPLHLVTFYDLEYSTAPVIQTLYYSFLLILLLFLIQGIQLFLLFISVYKSTKLKIRRFFMKWLRPRKNEDKNKIHGIRPMLPAEKYVRSILTQSILIVILIAIIIIEPHSPTAIFIFLVLPVYLFVFNYLLLEREETFREWKKLWLHPFIWLSVGFVLLINFSLYSFISTYYLAVIGQVIFVLVLFCGYHIQEPIRKYSTKKWISEKHFGKLYFILILMWLSLTAILPVLYFYQSVSFHENMTWRKYMIWEMAKNEEIKEFTVGRDGKLLAEGEQKVRENGNYIASTGEFETHSDTSAYTLQAFDPHYHFRFEIAFPFIGIIEKARAMLADAAADRKWKWYDHQENNSGVLLKFSDVHGQMRMYAGTLPIHSFWRSDYVVLFIVLFIAFGVLIVCVTIFAVRSIFGLGLVTDEKFIEYSREEFTVEKLIGVLFSAKHPQNPGSSVQHSNTVVKVDIQEPGKVFLVGLPHSGKSNILDEINVPVSNLGISVEELDLRNDLGKRIFPLEQQLYIIKNFEHGINDHQINQKKILLIQKLLNSKAFIIISSAVQPTAILEFYEAALKRINITKSEELRKEWSEYKHAVRIWKNLLGGFMVLYQPLSKIIPESLKIEFKDKPFARSELLHGQYLRSIHHLLASESCETYQEKENYVLIVEEIAESYYQSLWNSFSNSEKHLLYDLAKDRFVNLRNLAAIRVLMQKGVIVVEDTLSIMNRSFNNFILSVVKEDEELRMEKELNQKGSWSLVRAVIIIALIALTAFIALAQQNLLHDFNLLLGAIGSAAALLTRFGGLFSLGGRARE